MILNSFDNIIINHLYNGFSVITTSRMRRRSDHCITTDYSVVSVKPRLNIQFENNFDRSEIQNHYS